MADSYRLPKYEEDTKQNFFIRGLLSLFYLPIAIIVIALYGLILVVTGIINMFKVLISKKIWKTHYTLVAEFAMWQANMVMYIHGALVEIPIPCGRSKEIPIPCIPIPCIPIPCRPPVLKPIPVGTGDRDDLGDLGDPRDPRGDPRDPRDPIDPAPR